MVKERGERVEVGWRRLRRGGGRYSKQKAMNEVDAGRDRATPALIRQEDGAHPCLLTREGSVQNNFETTAQ